MVLSTYCLRYAAKTVCISVFVTLLGSVNNSFPANIGVLIEASMHLCLPTCCVIEHTNFPDISYDIRQIFLKFLVELLFKCMCFYEMKLHKFKLMQSWGELQSQLIILSGFITTADTFYIQVLMWYIIIMKILIIASLSDFPLKTPKTRNNHKLIGYHTGHKRSDPNVILT